MALVLPPDLGNAAIQRIWVECALLAAPLDAILAKIERNDIAHEARATPTTTLPHPAAMLSTPPRPMTYVGAVLSTMGGSTCATSLALAPPAIPSPIVDSQLRMVRQCARPCLVVALVAATVLAHPVLLTRSYPPNHTQCWGGFLCQLRPLPRWGEQPHLVAQWCHLRPSRGHPLLPPTYPLSSVSRYFYLWGEGPPIHFVLVIHHHRSAHDASTNFVVLANVMAPGLPIHRSTFFVGGVIGPEPPTNLL
jgi:hypothetical protein